MSTATSSVTTSDPSWAAPATQVAAPQWQSQEQYQQYYNYYQAMSQASAPATTTAAPVAPAAAVAADPSGAYPQDYSKAWDEYYKAYYGQSYTVSAPPTQYPATGYNYDQYGYPNMAAPPPVYQYESGSTPATAYQYPQVPPAAPAATSAYQYTDPSYTAPNQTASWNEPPPSYEKPSGYNQSYQQPSSSSSTNYDRGNLYQSSGDPSGHRDSSAHNLGDHCKTDNYMDRFPPPTFDKQGARPNNRGRGYNKGDQRPSTDSRDDKFRRPPYGNPRFGQNNGNNGSKSSYEYQNEESRGGGGAPYRGRGSDYRGRGGFKSSWNSGDSFAPKTELRDIAWKSELEKPDSSAAWDMDPEGAIPAWSSTSYGGQKRKSMLDTDESLPPRQMAKTAPVALMDIVIRPSVQSPIIVRRQNLIDQWQCAVRDIADRKLTIHQHWTTLKSGLVPEVQGLLSPSFVRGDNVIHCELHLDDIFLVQSKGYNEDSAIEEASKMMWQMLQTKLHVHTASRSWGADKVPVFCVSRSVNGPVSVPPFIKGLAPPAVDQQPAQVTEPAPANTVSTPAPHSGPINTANTAPSLTSTSSTATVAPAVKTDTTEEPLKHATMADYKDDDIFLVVDCGGGQNEKDQAISILNNTAKFNNISIEYKHEKPTNAPHISQCLITINGQEFEKSESRDYLFAKREAADKAVQIFRESCPQVTLNFERAKDVTKDEIVMAAKSVEESTVDFLKSFISSADNDDILKFAASFSNDEREAIMKSAFNLNLSSKTDGKTGLMVFKQYPIEEMKKRILRSGTCAQYRLVQACPGKESE